MTWGALLLAGAACSAQAATQRGFVEDKLTYYPEAAANDRVRLVDEALARYEAFGSPAEWLALAGGLDLRAANHHEVDDRWSLDFRDRGEQRPRLSIRRLAATLSQGPLAFEVGKQFVRWGATDIVNPTDRFAPRDYLNVVDSEFLGIEAAHATWQLERDTFEVVWTPRLTPSRLPLPDQRWAVGTPPAAGLPVVQADAPLPRGSQTGLRWKRVDEGFEYALSAFTGYNHLPELVPSPVFAPTIPPVPTAIQVARVYPRIRSIGGDFAWPNAWFTLKAEAVYISTSTATSDDYLSYVVQVERPSGEWLWMAGYNGELVTKHRASIDAAPDRGIAHSILARVSYTIDATSNAVFETAVRETGRGAYAKLEYSRGWGEHWRGTVTGVLLGGRDDDFFGRYRRNSNLRFTARYSF